MRRIFRFKTALAVIAFACAMLAASSGFAQYCLPQYANQCTSDDYIDVVIFAGINNSATGCGTPGLSNYTNYSGTYTANVTINQTYSITCAPGPTWGQYYVAMIDINHDNDFADAGEFYDVGYAPGGGSITNTITVPCGALTGPTRLRVMCQYSNTQLFQSDICSTTLSFGEVEDYNIIISPAAGTDAKAVKFVSPVSACGMGAAEQVRVMIRNVGGTTINGYTACYRIGAGAPVCETVATSIPACDSVTHIFAATANLSVAGQYDFDAWVTVAGDANQTNDTINNHLVDNIPVVGSLPYSQDFNATSGGWTSSGVNNSWAWGTPAGTFITNAASAPNAWTTSLTGPYNSDEVSYLTSPCFNFTSLTADPYLAFQHIYETDGWADYDFVEVTTNAGATWTKVGTYGTGNNWYNMQFSDYWSGFSGNAGEWQGADHQLTGVAGFSSVRFRFAFVSDFWTSYDGVGVDDIFLLDTLRNAGAIAFVAPANGCNLSATQAVTISLQNFGSHSISNIPVCYSFNGGPAVCETMPGPILPGTTGNYTFTATVNMSAVGSYTLDAYSNWSADFNRTNDTVSTTVQNFPVVTTMPYVEGFESGPAGWVSGGLAFDDWALGTPGKLVINGAAGGVNSWVTAGLGTAWYQNDANNWVESPCFDLSSLTNPWVALDAWWNSESFWDGTILEYSTNGGSTWTEIGVFGDPFNWYTEASINGLLNIGQSGNGWAGRQASSNGSGGWVYAKHEINALAGQTSVRFRIHFATDGSVVDDGFGWDNFIIADPPVVNLGADTTVCASLLLDPGLAANGRFDWSTGDTTSTLMLSTPGTYFLEYTDSLGLTNRDTINVAFSPTPPVDLGPDQLICNGSTNCFALDSLLYSNIHWSNGAATAQICVGVAGIYSVTADDSMGCTSTDTISTTVVAIPTPSLGLDTTLCPGDTICLFSNCGVGHTYTWSTGASTQDICVSIVSGYWVQCTDSNGCSDRDSIIITQGTVPTAFGTADTSGCPIVVFANTSTGGNDQIWDFGDGSPTSNNSNPSHDYTSAGNGSYTVTLISINACGNDTTTIQVDINCLVSIGSAFENQLKLFPNPNRGSFKLETMLDGTAPVEVTITDLHGRAVYQKDFGQAAGRFSEQIDLLNQTKGVYFVKFDVGGKVEVRKVVVQ